MFDEWVRWSSCRRKKSVDRLRQFYEIRSSQFFLQHQLPEEAYKQYRSEMIGPAFRQRSGCERESSGRQEWSMIIRLEVTLIAEFVDLSNAEH